jgi:signal transduction histidine kinase
MRIRTRLTLIYSIATAFLLLIALGSIYYLFYSYEKKEFREILKSKAISSADLLLRVDEVDSTMLKIFDINKKDILFFENISIFDSSFVEIYTSNDSLHFDEMLTDLSSKLTLLRQDNYIEFSDRNFEMVGVTYTHNGLKYLVLASAFDQQGNQLLWLLFWVMVFVYLLFLLLIAYLGWYYSGKALQPIASIVREVQQMNYIRPGNRLTVKGEDEIGELSLTINQLFERIDQAFVIQKRFVSHASHELMNPLTSITAQLEVAMLNDRDAEVYKKVIASVLEDMKRLNEISHLLLDLTRLDAGVQHFPMKEVDVDEVLWGSFQTIRSGHPEYQIEYVPEWNPEHFGQPLILANADLMKLVFINLMENACKFSDNKKVVVKLAEHSPGVYVVEFIDTGIGIPESELKNLFEPFFRGAKSRKYKGYGIGLSIVKRILDIHQFRYEVKSTPGVGTTFSIWLKKF